MQEKQYSLWEDDEFVYVPEELFEYLPKEYREAAESLKKQGEDVLRIVDKDLQGLVKLCKAIPTSASLSYIYHRLRTSKFEPTMEAVMEQEVLTTAFIVTYGRLFASGSGTTGMSRRDIPEHLKPIHDEIIELRNKRYAHNASHQTVDSGIEVNLGDDGFRIKPEITFGVYFGGRNEWEDLIKFIDAHMHDRLMKVISRLKEKTGYDWTFPNGPAPDWVGNDG